MWSLAYHEHDKQGEVVAEALYTSGKERLRDQHNKSSASNAGVRQRGFP